MKQATCPECAGDGEVMAEVSRNFRGVDPPMTTCPECAGDGEIWAEEEWLEELVDCPCCEGYGEIDIPRTPNNPFDVVGVPCPFCKKDGQVSREKALDYNPEDPENDPTEEKRINR